MNRKIENYRYLGTMYTEDRKSAEGIERRLAVAKEEFTNKEKLLFNKRLDLV